MMLLNKRIREQWNLSLGDTLRSIINHISLNIAFILPGQKFGPCKEMSLELKCMCLLKVKIPL